MNNYLNVIRNNYTNFEGRARRHEYWMFMLWNSIISLVLYVLIIAFALPSVLAADKHNSINPALTVLGILLIVLYCVYSLGILVPGIALSVRRLHDAGYSGWLLLLSFVPFIGGLVMLVFMVQDSTPGSNKWGPNPKGISDAIPTF